MSQNYKTKQDRSEPGESRHSNSQEYNDDRSRSASDLADLLSLLLPILRDFIPILLERWANVSNRPTMHSIEDENRRLKEKIEQLDRKLLWLSMFQVVTGLFFLLFVVLVAFKII